MEMWMSNDYFYLSVMAEAYSNNNNIFIFIHRIKTVA